MPNPDDDQISADMQEKMRTVFGKAMDDDNVQEALRKTVDPTITNTTQAAVDDIAKRLHELGDMRLVGIVLFELVGMHLAAVREDKRKAMLEIHAECAWAHMLALDEARQHLKAELAKASPQ